MLQTLKTVDYSNQKPHFKKQYCLFFFLIGCDKNVYNRWIQTKIKAPPASLTSHRTPLLIVSYEFLQRLPIYFYAAFPHEQDYTTCYITIHYFACSFFFLLSDLALAHFSLCMLRPASLVLKVAWDDTVGWTIMYITCPINGHRGNFQGFFFFFFCHFKQ